MADEISIDDLTEGAVVPLRHGIYDVEALCLGKSSGGYQFLFRIGENILYLEVSEGKVSIRENQVDVRPYAVTLYSDNEDLGFLRSKERIETDQRLREVNL